LSETVKATKGREHEVNLSETVKATKGWVHEVDLSETVKATKGRVHEVDLSETVKATKGREHEVEQTTVDHEVRLQVIEEQYTKLKHYNKNTESPTGNIQNTQNTFKTPRTSE
jgi:hypothetical protein